MTDTDLVVVAALAPAAGWMTVDPLTGRVARDDRGAEPSAADAAALEVALRLGEHWAAPVVAVSAGRAGARSVLRRALTVGVDRAIHVDTDAGAPPVVVAEALASAVGSSEKVFAVAGTHGSDVASAAVPACLAHHFGAEQALGLVRVDVAEPGRCEVVRRLDRGERERLVVTAPAVISVEGSVASLRRAGLRALLTDSAAPIENVVVSVGHPGPADIGVPRPWRPRARVVDAPSDATALARIRDLAGVSETTKSARTVEADPGEAAEMILEALGAWGHGPRATGV
ncbi:MAG: hypothetical protein JST73_13215 [Actinobacteria bacterium]|nr:hypothetical protein [Actinomycetota bacterium]